MEKGFWSKSTGVTPETGATDKRYFQHRIGSNCQYLTHCRCHWHHEHYDGFGDGAYPRNQGTNDHRGTTKRHCFQVFGRGNNYQHNRRIYRDYPWDSTGTHDYAICGYIDHRFPHIHYYFIWGFGYCWYCFRFDAGTESFETGPCKIAEAWLRTTGFRD